MGLLRWTVSQGSEHPGVDRGLGGSTASGQPPTDPADPGRAACDSRMQFGRIWADSLPVSGWQNIASRIVPSTRFETVDVACAQPVVCALALPGRQGSFGTLFDLIWQTV